jgi:excisionase family DNA binding protein
MEPQFSTREEVANLLRVSLNTLRRMEKRGEIPTVRVGQKCVRIPALFVLRITGRATCTVRPKAPTAESSPKAGVAHHSIRQEKT